MHKLTPVQRQVITWMREAEGQIRISQGHKRTARAVDSVGEPIIFCSYIVTYPLLTHGYIEKADGIITYRLTKKGWSA